MPQKEILLARNLIKQKRYRDAQIVLERLNHPTAERWLDKLDEILISEGLDDAEKEPHFPIISVGMMCIAVAITAIVFTRLSPLPPQHIVAFCLISMVSIVNAYLQLSNYVGNQNG